MASRAARWRIAHAAHAQGAAPDTAEITIDTTVVAPDPERFGANIEVFDYEPWTHRGHAQQLDRRRRHGADHPALQGVSRACHPPR